jgi:PKD repeat protein
MTATNSLRLDPCLSTPPLEKTRMCAVNFNHRQMVAVSAWRPLIARRVGNRALLTIVVFAAGTLAIGPAPATAEAQTATVISAPVVVAAPKDYSTDSTPTWMFTGEPGASFSCTLSQPFQGMWDGGGSGEEPPPEPVIVDSGSCDSGSYSFNLGAYPDRLYGFSVTQTDASGNTSEPASEGFRLDRIAYTPIILTSPDEVTNDPTPTWTFYAYGELGSQFHCTVTRAGTSPPVYDGGCSTERFTFDLNPYPDDSYTLSVTQTDLAGNTSAAVTDGFVLDRSTPNVTPSASFAASCIELTCKFEGGASADGDGQIVSYAWAFGDGSGYSMSGSFTDGWHSYNAPGVYTVTLTVTDNANATATDSHAVTVGTPPPLPNTPPTAAFDVSCAGLSCSVDAGDSTDPDGTITGRAWEFGDGSTASGKTAQHSYRQLGSYTIRLRVTDDDGATSTATKTIGLITLTANGYKRKGAQTVELSWNGSSASGFDVYRDGQKLAAVAGNSYTDNLNRKGAGNYGYQVCAPGASICSNHAAVSF